MTNLRAGRRPAPALAALWFGSILIVLVAESAFATSADLVISQVYGGGGGASASYTNDFVEVFNRGTAAVSLSGKSIQYASAAGTGNFGGNTITPLPAVTLSPGQYFLMQGAGGATGAPLPTPDVTSTLNMSATAGKVALVNSTAGLACNGSNNPCSPAQLALIIDLVGYGSTANFFEGSAPAPTLSSTLAAFRAPAGQGCTDTDNNAADFASGTPAPRNTASALAPCAGSTNPSGSGAATPNLLVPGDATLLTVAVTPGANPTSTGLAVTTDLTAIGGGASQTFFDDGTNGDATAGDNTFSFATSVAPGTSVGAKSLPVTITDAQARTGTSTIPLNVVTITPIHTLQGSGSMSPYAGTNVTTSGIVTGVKSNGFFIELPDAEWDADASTSEGIFVFTSSAPLAAAAVGNRVNVNGTLQEFIPSGDTSSPPTTEIASPSLSVVSTGNPLPPAITITTADANPASPIENLEKYEGMRVHVDSLTVIGPTGGSIIETSATSTSNGVFYGVITGTTRPFREAGIQAPTPPPNPPCCIPQWDNNPERIRVASSALVGATALDVTAGAIVTNVTGPLDYGFRTYTIDPDAGTPPSVSGNVTYTAVPARNSNEFTVACQNLERFFDTANNGASGEPVLTAAAYEMRLAKASLLVRHVLRSPDILGVEEVETLSVLQTLATRINDDAVTNGEPNPNYQAYLVEGNDIGGIDVGFLVNATRVVVNSVTQVGKNDTYNDPSVGGAAVTLWDRPPLVLDATIVDGGINVVVIVNHLRSLSGIEGSTSLHVRSKRQAEAEWLANYVQSRQVANADEKLVLVGDFNAYEVNDGYVDVMGTIRGTPTPSDNVLFASGDLVNPDLTDLLDMLPSLQKYSYAFDGSAQTLDHILVNSKISPHFSRMSYGRSDADFPEVYRGDALRPERLSDHDGGVAYFTYLPTGTHLQVAAPANVTQGNAFSVTVTAVDNSSATVTNYSGTVHFTSSDPLAVLPADYTFTVADAGAHTFTNEFTLGTTGTQSITATDSIDASITGIANVDVACDTVPTPTATNDGPYFAGATIHLFASTVSGASYSWTGPGGFTSGQQNPTIANATLANAGTYSVTATVGGCTSAAGTTDVVVNAVAPPTNVVATTITPTSVSVTWTAAAGAGSYDILRREPGAPFALIGTSSSTGYTDNTAVVNNAYLYAVRSVDASANRSANSAADLATTFVFTDDPIVAGSTIVRAVHFEELRSAINTLRALGGLGSATFTDPSLADVVVKGTHIDEMRSALDAARAALFLATLSYTDPSITAGTTMIKAVHVTELRDGVR